MAVANGHKKVVDLRSDTVTKPSAAMLAAIAELAPDDIGDDIYGEARCSLQKRSVKYDLEGLRPTMPPDMLAMCDSTLDRRGPYRQRAAAARRRTDRQGCGAHVVELRMTILWLVIAIPEVVRLSFRMWSLHRRCSWPPVHRGIWLRFWLCAGAATKFCSAANPMSFTTR